ncbi:MAG: ATP-binding cassette, subfamily bacterial MsbA [Chthoniobacter sp.]|nr:ATP-binding cassette, subfamily bacterial MsbA [Chthoniobacter sp.]
MLAGVKTSFRGRWREMQGPYGALRQFLKPYWLRFALGMVCGAVFGFLNGSLPWVIQQVSGIIFYSKAENPFLARYMQNGVPPATVVLLACLAIPAVMVLRGIFSFANSYLVEWVSGRVLMDLRGKLLERITSQSVDFFNHSRSGHLISRIANDTREAQTALTTMSTDLVVQPISLITGLFVLFHIDWRFMAATLILFPLCILPARSIGRRIRASAKSEEMEKGDMMVILHEIIAGIKVIKSFSRTAAEIERFNASGEAQFHHAMRVKRAMESHAPLVESIAAAGVGLAFWYVWQAHLPGHKFVALCAGIFLLYQPIKSLTRLHLLLQRCHAATSSIMQFFEIEPSVQDAPDAARLPRCRGEIVFEKVTFGYRPGLPALSDVNLRFEPGKFYALVGPSGAGKSTLLSLILRFYDPQSGCVRIDGQDVREVMQDSLRDNIGVVAQETFLFHDTIAKNIAYGKPGSSRAEVIAVAQQAHAHDFVLAQHNGYDTVVGDKGCMLSGGQQQRIAIARALLKDAPVLLLDEATSSLDSESEAQIQAGLETLASGRSVIAIAHRLSTILKADEIIVIEHGHVIERGDHRTLIEKSGIYRRLYDLQFHRESAPELVAV